MSWSGGALGYRQDADGAWSVVGPDGFSYDPEEYRDLIEDERREIPHSLDHPVIDATPTRVTDTETRREITRGAQ